MHIHDRRKYSKYIFNAHHLKTQKQHKTKIKIFIKIACSFFILITTNCFAGEDVKCAFKLNDGSLKEFAPQKCETLFQSSIIPKFNKKYSENGYSVWLVFEALKTMEITVSALIYSKSKEIVSSPFYGSLKVGNDTAQAAGIAFVASGKQAMDSMMASCEKSPNCNLGN